MTSSSAVGSSDPQQPHVRTKLAWPAGNADARLGQTRVPPARARDQRYEWAYIFGAVCPARQATAALILPCANAEAMSLHLAEIGKKVAVGAHAVLILDGAGYHKASALSIPANISLLKLPPYAPELNPAENVWEYLRQRWLSNHIFDDYDAILDAVCDAWNRLIAEPARIQSIGSRQWAISGEA